MSTSEQEKQTAKLLKQMNIESLSRSHNSVNISYKQMLAYIDNVRKAVPEGDIRDLLDTYRSMADAFYIQFESTLLADIRKIKDTLDTANDAVQCIDEMRNGSPTKLVLERAKSLLVEDASIAAIEYARLQESFPSLMQNALDKLRDEWQRLNSFAAASQALTENEKLDRSLKAVVEVAAHSVGVEAERIVIVPGNAFALYFFTYRENLAVLTVPIYSVQSLWEWSIFWHELAGYKVRRLEKSVAMESIQKKLIAFHDLFKVSDETIKKDLINSIAWDNPFSREYLWGIFFQNRPNLDDLGGFEHQFERIALALVNAGKLQAYEQIRASGWCVDWIKELFEDAWSVLTLGEPFLGFFNDVLDRNASKDDRHPPLKVRLSVAKELLKLADPNSTIENEPDLVEGYAAQQILKFVSLLRAASRHYGTPVMDEMDFEMIFAQSIRDELLDKVRDGIRESITRWSEKFLTADNPSRRIINNTRIFLEIFSDDALEKVLAKLDQYEARQKKQGYKDLLKDKDYRQLLKLSFSEVDYHTPGDVQLLESGKPYWVKPTDWNSTAWLAQRRRVVQGILTTEILITEVSSQVDWRVNTADWNSWFKMTQ